MIFDYRSENKLYKAITGVIAFSLFVALLASIWEQHWLNLFLIVLTVTLFPIIEIIGKKYNFKFPGELQLVIILFIYTGVFLGGVVDYYYRFWWFDSLLHFISGLGLGLIGFLIPYILYKTNKIKTSFFFIALFGFSFALSLGVLWEIFEFFMDHFLGLNMQKARNLEIVHGYFSTRLGVIDTMYDLILDSLGAFATSVAGYFYLKNGEFFIFDKVVERIESKNPKIFKDNA